MQVRFSNGDIEEYEDNGRNGGAQGDVFWPAKAGGYRAGEEPNHVVKLYKYDLADAAKARGLEDRVRKLVEEYNPTAGDPYWREFYAWPDKRVVAPRVGFRMPWALRMRRIDDYLYLFDNYWELPPEQRGWFIGRLVVAMKLALAANRLANTGLCYADFSHRNAMVDPFEGRMMLIDCDAVTIPHVIPPDVLGTPGYLAPELILGEATPSIRTDRYSLATLFYLWFLGHHPLDGDHPPHSLDPAEDAVHQYADRALYIEHPTDASNHWKIQPFKSDALGEDIKQLFRDAFVGGIRDPAKRPRPQLWAEAFAHAYDRVIPCDSPRCEWRFFVAQPRPGLTCPLCSTRVTAVRSLPRVYIQRHANTANPDAYDENVNGQHWVVGWPGRTFHDWHVRGDTSPFHTDNSDPDRTPRAEFAYDAHKDAWFIVNRSGAEMGFRHADDAPWEHWAAGAPLQLHDGMRLQFGAATVFNRGLVKVVGLNA